MDTPFRINLSFLADQMGCQPSEVLETIKSNPQEFQTSNWLLMLLRCDYGKIHHQAMELFDQAVRTTENQIVRQFRVSPSISEDLIQQARFALFRKLADEAFEPRQLLAYYSVILRNIMKKHARQMARNQALFAQPQDEEPTWLETADTEPLPAERMVEDERRSILLRKIEQLPKRQREVIELRYLKELSYEEVQQYFGHSSLQVTRNLCSVALMKLKELFAHEGDMLLED
ncbi:sigma-70 family RNA polymerase sigma factor [Pontibacter sp. G13]|uniref:RNA polymerase sigma factor n=1 Tax=Pontibacter sp. G13 TaxID=3074898 RepID=UPI00288C498C|nr:sigma-70 family RNA polymerase sigma factor [Pontibacter sp. G13]WNJ19520.1 sigma-70 family RNA polymerase sigma factor [Pontibacter sp. G13]